MFMTRTQRPRKRVATTILDGGATNTVSPKKFAQCNSKVAADFQKKGDWCKEHDRPESQCFVCHPDLEAKFAAAVQGEIRQEAT